MNVALTDDSYAKNFIADSGKIFATDRPFPVQKASRPPSAYIRVTADASTLNPPGGFAAVAGCSAPPSSGGLVIRNTFKRSKGAVQVRDTSNEELR